MKQSFFLGTQGGCEDRQWNDSTRVQRDKHLNEGIYQGLEEWYMYQGDWRRPPRRGDIQASSWKVIRSLLNETKTYMCHLSGSTYWSIKNHQCLGGIVRHPGFWNSGLLSGSHKEQKPDVIRCSQKKYIIHPILLGKRKKLTSPASYACLAAGLVPSFLLPLLSDSKRPVSFSELLPTSVAIVCLFSIPCALGALWF